jgi:hypothetical protein
LQNPAPQLPSVTKINSDSQIEQAREQNEDVPGAIQHSHAIAHANHVIPVNAHVLSCQQESDEKEDAEC